MVTSPTGKGVIVMHSRGLLELSSNSMEWTRLEQTLQITHFAPLAIPIPDELVYEKNESEHKEPEPV